MPVNISSPSENLSVAFYLISNELLPKLPFKWYRPVIFRRLQKSKRKLKKAYETFIFTAST